MTIPASWKADLRIVLLAVPVFILINRVDSTPFKWFFDKSIWFRYNLSPGALAIYPNTAVQRG
jgi:hypothetical protein